MVSHIDDELVQPPHVDVQDSPLNAIARRRARKICTLLMPPLLRSSGLRAKECKYRPITRPTQTFTYNTSGVNRAVSVVERRKARWWIVLTHDPLELPFMRYAQGNQKPAQWAACWLSADFADFLRTASQLLTPALIGKSKSKRVESLGFFVLLVCWPS